MSNRELESTPSSAWPVGVLVRAMGDAISARFNPVRVTGELSGLTRASSGHCYFTLKDADGQLRCAMFRRSVGALTRWPADGESVEVEGRLDVYTPRGDLQLIVERLRPCGQGLWLERFLRLKAQLAAEGVFDDARKRALPALPKAVAVVTSLEAAALRDVTSTLARRAPHLPVVVFPSLVQGHEAPAALCRALDAAERWQQAQAGVNPSELVLLLVRGGGSLEDLWAFNDEQVVRRLARMPMPTVSGVGHQTDLCLTDFAADVRAATPTAAAELCAPEAAAVLNRVQAAEDALQRAVWRRLDREDQRLDGLAVRLQRPGRQVTQQRVRWERLQAQWNRAIIRKKEHWTHAHQALERDFHQRIQSALAVRRRHLDGLEAGWAAMNPSTVLQRGYAWLETASGHTLVKPDQVQPGEVVRAHLALGEVDLTVC